MNTLRRINWLFVIVWGGYVASVAYAARWL